MGIAALALNATSWATSHTICPGLLPTQPGSRGAFTGHPNCHCLHAFRGINRTNGLKGPYKQAASRRLSARACNGAAPVLMDYPCTANGSITQVCAAPGVALRPICCVSRHSTAGQLASLPHSMIAVCALRKRSNKSWELLFVLLRKGETSNGHCQQRCRHLPRRPKLQPQTPQSSIRRCLKGPRRVIAHIADMPR